MTTPNTSQTPESPISRAVARIEDALPGSEHDADSFQKDVTLLLDHFKEVVRLANKSNVAWAEDFESLELRLIASEKRCEELKADNKRLRKTISDIERFAKAGYCMTISKAFMSGKIKVTKLQYNNFKDRTTIQPTLQEAVAAFMAKCDCLPTPPTNDAVKVH